MLPADIAQTVLELPVEDRLELARRLVESVVRPAVLNESVAERIRRIEDVAAELPRLSVFHPLRRNRRFADPRFRYPQPLRPADVIDSLQVRSLDS